MSPRRAILLELSLAFSRILLGLISFIIQKLPARMLACLMCLDPRFQVAAVPVVQLAAFRFNQHINVMHGIYAKHHPISSQALKSAGL